MANFTTNYGLHQWEASDNFLRTDFNTDFSIIDGALAGLEADKPELMFGSYTGDKASTRTIALGFRPKAVLAVSYGGLNTDTMDHMLVQLAMDGQPAEQLTITEGGFTVRFRMNDTSWGAYHYLAVK